MTGKFKVGDRVRAAETVPVEQGPIHGIGIVIGIGQLAYVVKLDGGAFEDDSVLPDGGLYFYEDELEAE